MTPGNTRFVVALLCRNGAYALWMSSGLITPSGRSKREKFFQTADKAKAQTFAKYAAEDIVQRLKTNYRIIARIEPATHPEPAPYSR